MQEAWVFDTVRTPRGRGRDTGGLYVQRPVDLLAGLLRDLADERQLDTAEVDDVVMGCVTESGEQGGCIARFAALQAGWDEDAPGVTLNRFCGSGLQAVNQAACMVASGFHDLVVAGGVESMSRVAMGSDGGAMWDARTQFSVGSVRDLRGPHRHPGDLRAEVDAFALESQRRAGAAISVGMTAACGRSGRGRDDPARPRRAPPPGHHRREARRAEAQLPRDGAALRPRPLVNSATPGLSSTPAGALGHRGRRGGGPRWPQGQGRGPGASAPRPSDLAVVGAEPIIMLTGPVPAAEKALRKARCGVGHRPVRGQEPRWSPCIPEAGVPLDRINVNGGAIALGHPLEPPAPCSAPCSTPWKTATPRRAS